MSKYVQISDEIDQLKPMANLVMDTVPYQNRTGFESVKNQAVTRTAELEAEFAKLVADNAVYVFLDGPDSVVKEFTTEAAEEFETITLSANTWDKSVGSSWWKANGEKAGGIDTVHTIQLLDSLRHTMVDLKLTELETPNVPSSAWIGSEEDCTKLVKSITTAQCGGVFRLALLQDEAVKWARALRWAGETNQPIMFIVLDSSPEERQAVGNMTKRAFNLSVTKLTEKGVENALANIVKRLKSSK
jgi:hypothetical protein